jgi:hypothetical protein
MKEVELNKHKMSEEVMVVSEVMEGVVLLDKIDKDPTSNQEMLEEVPKV